MASRDSLFKCVIAVITPLLAAPCGAQEGEAQSTYILATGRRLPYPYAISLDDAIDPANNNTSNAIVSRRKVALDRLDGRLLVDPANLIVSEDGGTVYVVNHHGSIDKRGHVYVIDIRSRSVVGTVTGVGNDPYALATVIR